jgi:SPP1 gp7 family putative phage head morphogenesis protein
LGFGIGRDITDFLEGSVIPEVNGAVESGLGRLSLGKVVLPDGRRPWDTKAYRNAMKRINKTLRNGANGANGIAKRHLVELAATEDAWMRSVVVGEATVPIAALTPAPSAALSAIVTAQPMSGHTMKAWFEGLSRGVGRAIDARIQQGMLDGDTIGTITKDLVPLLRDGMTGDAVKIARTATNHVSNHARQATLRENADVVKGWVFVATLDNRTCPICGPLDGQEFPVGEGPIPPRHPNCRCTASPLLKSFRELGLPFKEFEPADRASMNGVVPAKVTYRKWLRQQPHTVQNQVLGATRAKLWRGNKITIDRFSTDKRLLNLDRLKKLEPDAFPKT